MQRLEVVSFEFFYTFRYCIHNNFLLSSGCPNGPVSSTPIALKGHTILTEDLQLSESGSDSDWSHEILAPVFHSDK